MNSQELKRTERFNPAPRENPHSRAISSTMGLNALIECRHGKRRASLSAWTMESGRRAAALEAYSLLDLQTLQIPHRVVDANASQGSVDWHGALQLPVGRLSGSYFWQTDGDGVCPKDRPDSKSIGYGPFGTSPVSKVLVCGQTGDVGLAAHGRCARLVIRNSGHLRQPDLNRATQNLNGATDWMAPLQKASEAAKSKTANLSGLAWILFVLPKPPGFGGVHTLQGGKDSFARRRSKPRWRSTASN